MKKDSSKGNNKNTKVNNKRKTNTKKEVIKKEEEVLTEKFASKNNFTRGLVIFIVGVILLILCLWSTGTFNKNSDALKFYSEYGNSSTITEDNLYKYASKEEVLDLLDHKTGVLYFGFSTCPWCQTIVPILNQVASDNGQGEILYYDIKRDRNTLSLNEQGEVVTDKESTNFYRELLKELDDVASPYILTDDEGKEVDTGEKRIYVPLVVFVKEGKVVYSHEATVESQEDPKVKLNDKQKDELADYYKKGFNLIK